MSSGWDYAELAPPLSDQRVDNISSQQGVLDELPQLNIDIPDGDLIHNLDIRIRDSQSYWDDPEGFNLNEVRQENKRLHIGKQVDVTKLYRFQVPYIENEIFVAVETIIAYLTSQQPQPEVYPAEDEIQQRKFAIDLEKALSAHSQKFELSRKMEQCVRNLMLKRIGVLKIRFDPRHGKLGEVVPEVVDPENLIIDKNAVQDGNPEFICHVLKYSIQELISRFPDKEKEILKEYAIDLKNPQGLTKVVVCREVWFTHYEDNEPKEAVTWITGNLVLDKMKNPNWLYNSDNFLECPEKPFIPLNYINDGSHWIDLTTPVEQASNQQQILNKRGRQIMENADKANGLLVIATESGLSKDDAMNMTGDPNQKIIIKTNGNPINQLVYNVPPHDLPSYVMDDKLDNRQTIHNIMGTPPQMRGDQDNDQKTLGEALMIKNQATGRQDLIVRAIDAFMYKYFNFLVQMMYVWYDDKHFFVYNSGDGDFDYITLHRKLIDTGMQVSVKSGTTLPFDKSRQEAVALQLAKMEMIDPYNLYRDLHMDRAQKRYDAWFKWKTNPQQLARDNEDEVAETKAYVEFIEVMGGKKVEPSDDADKEHILTLRKLMLTDKFLKAPKARQLALIELVDRELQQLELRTSLDLLSNQNPELLQPGTPIPSPQQLQQQPPTGMPPQGMTPPQGQPMGPPPGQPPMGPPPGQPNTPLANTNPMAGVGNLQAPNNSTMQPSTNPAILPSI